MTARQIMDGSAMWDTRDRTASDYYWPIYRATDRADWLESGVLVRENTLNASRCMAEATK